MFSCDSFYHCDTGNHWRGMVDYLTNEEEIEAWIKNNFAGYGAAIRLKKDPPIPGEPFMSMADAKQLTRMAITEFVERDRRRR